MKTRNLFNPDRLPYAGKYIDVARLFAQAQAIRAELKALRDGKTTGG